MSGDLDRDHHAIAALVFRYAELVDLGEFAAVAELFANATYRAVAGAGVHTRTGAVEVREQFEQLVITYDGTPSTKHVTTNLVMDVDADAQTATARSYFTVLQARPELPLQIIIAGRYHDAFARIDGEWRFTDRLIFSDLAGDLRRHLRAPKLLQ
jgi:3-phenylpropionate/cinnamic acid dioxygenase small subunit